MNRVQAIRQRIREGWKVDKYTATQAAEQLARAGRDAQDITAGDIERVIVALWRHKRTDYDRKADAVSGYTYNGAYADLKREYSAEQAAKLAALRVY